MTPYLSSDAGCRPSALPPPLRARGLDVSTYDQNIPRIRNSNKGLAATASARAFRHELAVILLNHGGDVFTLRSSSATVTST